MATARGTATSPDREPAADRLAWPKFRGFPFELFGIEVKRSAINSFRDYTQALKQSCDYSQSTITDKRCVRSAGRCPQTVFLFCGRHSEWMGYRDEMDRGAVRMIGKFNIGEITYGSRWDGARFEISAEPLWSERRGVAGVGARWRTERPIGDGRRRAA